LFSLCPLLELGGKIMRRIRQGGKPWERATSGRNRPSVAARAGKIDGADQRNCYQKNEGSQKSEDNHG